MSGINIILDTNAVGLYLENKSFKDKYVKNFKQIGISVITKIEFLTNPALSPKHKFLFEDFIEEIDVYPISCETKELIAEIIAIRKKYKIKLPDAIIAATAKTNNAFLLSTDKIFSKIHNLKFIHIIK